ncbi:hypothetical protein AQJ84_35465 [Streptomyces resistomycificus]|uniref:Uncharacterized protein n=1 Tax=Streptomyces resistomycificus TaxID=67356 RepID=A0A0L8L6N7_9ACTN|nr:hypothetical protein ADK37_21120 [Streptomyces resistomycificus]KUN91796.1 hypothetical protein AQJ84_35465 [Streptomyces resistomycificus]
MHRTLVSRASPLPRRWALEGELVHVEEDRGLDTEGAPGLSGRPGQKGQGAKPWAPSPLAYSAWAAREAIDARVMTFLRLWVT